MPTAHTMRGVGTGDLIEAPGVGSRRFHVVEEDTDAR
jgi:hypothetical protein